MTALLSCGQPSQLNFFWSYPLSQYTVVDPEGPVLLAENAHRPQSGEQSSHLGGARPESRAALGFRLLCGDNTSNSASLCVTANIVSFFGPMCNFVDERTVVTGSAGRLRGKRQASVQLPGQHDARVWARSAPVRRVAARAVGQAEAGAKTAEAGGKAAESVALLSCTREKVEDYIACLSSEGLRATTINRKIYSLNSFYVWAVHHQLMPASPLVGVRKLKIPRRIPKFLTFEDIEKLLTYTGIVQADVDDPREADSRDDLDPLLPRDPARGAGQHHIRPHREGERRPRSTSMSSAKGDKQRMIPFPPPAFEAYQAYNRFRPECATPKIFINLKTRQPMSKFAVNSVCDHLHKRLKLSKKLTPHVLRHTFATHLHLKGQPIEHINALLGHESMNTTMIYCPYDAGKLRQSVEQLYKQAIS